MTIQLPGTKTMEQQIQVVLLQTDIVTNAANAQDVKVADMDGDGDLDLVSASPTDDTVAWYENDGAANPSFTKAVIATSADEVRNIDLADMDGDGDIDIVSASGVDDTIAWYENNGAADPTFGQQLI